jgi:rhodanese-related sulfurtransferase
MTMKKTLFVTLLMTALLLAACSPGGAPQPIDASEASEAVYTPISVETLAEMMDARRESFLLVNTHIPFEGNLPGTDLSVAYNETSDHLDLFPEDKDAEIVLYCLNDPMSRSAAEQLLAAGYRNVKILTGGMNAWLAAGLPLEMEL